MVEYVCRLSGCVAGRGCAESACAAWRASATNLCESSIRIRATASRPLGRKRAEKLRPKTLVNGRPCREGCPLGHKGVYTGGGGVSRKRGAGAGYRGHVYMWVYKARLSVEKLLQGFGMGSGGFHGIWTRGTGCEIGCGFGKHVAVVFNICQSKFMFSSDPLRL